MVHFFMAELFLSVLRIYKWLFINLTRSARARGLSALIADTDFNANGLYLIGMLPGRLRADSHRVILARRLDFRALHRIK